jgi:hypothetical protein
VQEAEEIGMNMKPMDAEATDTDMGGHGCGVGSKRFFQREGGHQLGRSNYIISELEYMLKSVRNIIPILGAEWDLVASCHETFHPTWDVLGTGWKKSTSSIGPGIQTSLPLSVRQRRSMS